MGTKKYELTAQQKRVFLLSKLASTQPLFNLCYEIHYHGTLDPQRFARALEQLTQIHQVFRLKIRYQQGSVFQEIAENTRLNYQFLNLRKASDQKEKMKNILELEGRRKFNLVENPLYYFILIEKDVNQFVLCMNIHHIIADGISIGIIRKEIIRLYTDLEIEQTSVKVSPFTDYLQWSFNLPKQQKYLSAQIYWQYLKKVNTDELNIMTDYPRSRLQSYAGDIEEIRLDEHTRHHLSVLAFKNKIPLAVLLLTAYLILLKTYSQQNEIIVGMLVHGRTGSLEFKKMIGFFSNLIPIGVQFSKHERIRDLIQSVNELVNQGYDHQNYPLEKIVQDINPTRDSSRPPLFQAVFNLQKELDLITSPIIAETHCRRINTRTSQYELTMHIFDSSQGLKIQIEYNCTLFARCTVETMLRIYQRIIETMITNIATPVDQINLLDQKAKNRLTKLSQSAISKETDQRSIMDYFRSQVQKNGEELALAGIYQSYSYQQLDALTTQLATIVIEKNQGSKQNRLCAVLIERSEYITISFLGVLKARGIYMPIDISLPEERIRYMLEDSKANLLLTQADVLKDNDWLQNFYHKDQIILLDQHFTEKPTIDLPVIDDLDQPAYLIYTSGSTGKPKGALLKHRGVANLAHFFNQQLQIDSSDRIIQFYNIGFDASVWEQIMSLSTGAKLFVLPEESKFSYQKFTSFINRWKITVITLPPSYIAYLDPGQIKYLKQMIVAGEPSYYQEIMRWKDDVTYINAYGPTETTICATIWQGKERKDQKVPIGQPILGTRLYIVNEAEKLLPIGVPGEICIAGEGVAAGYVNRPKLNNEKFIQLPHEEGKVFKTGDQGRWLADGLIEFLGRKDEQVKIRGFRIEMGEIENILRSHPKIINAVVVVQGDSEKQLTAYFVATHEMNQKDLKLFLTDKLPQYMIPDYLVQLNQLPMTENNKVDKEKLPPPEPISNQKQLPGTEIEKKIATIWKKICGVEQVHVTDKFFDMGGTSLKLILLNDMLLSNFEVDLPLHLLFQYPTIRQLADFINKKDKEQAYRNEDPFNKENSLLINSIKYFGGSKNGQ